MESKFRQFKGPARWFIRGLYWFLPLYATVYLLGFFDGRYFKLIIMPIQHRALCFAIVLALTFLMLPATKKEPKDRLPWYDMLLLAIALAGPLYMLIFYNKIIGQIGAATTIQVILCMTSIVTILEGCRRSLGWIIPGLGVVFTLHAFFGYLIPGPLFAPHYDVARVASHLYLWPEGIFGVPLAVAFTVIIAFFIFGQFIGTTGTMRFFLDLALWLTGTMKGGPAKVAVVASSFFGTMSGSAMANAAAVGTFTIPMMKSVGYRSEFAGAVEAVASTGGQLMPPVMGAAAFLIAEFLEISYIKVCLYAFIPAILYYLALFVVVHIEAVKAGLYGLPRAELPPLGKTLKAGWQNLLPLIALIVFMGALYYRPETSVLYTLGLLIVVNLFRKETRLTPKSLASALEGSSATMLEIGAVCGVAGIIIASVYTTGLTTTLSMGLIRISGGHLIVLLILVGVVCYIMGMGMPTTAIYIMVVILVAPAIIDLGVLPIAAHLFIFYWAMTSMFTPPMAYAVFVTAGIAGSTLWRTGFESMRLGIMCLLVPFLFVYNPALLAQGTILEIVLTAVKAIIGTISLAFALERHALKPMNWGQVVLAGGGGIALFLPSLQISLMGLAAVVMAMAWNLLARKT